MSVLFRSSLPATVRPAPALPTPLLSAPSAPTAPTKPQVAPTTPDTDTDTVTRPVTDDGDHDRFAHYVDKSKLTAAYVEGTPVRALCGKLWVPTRDPDRYPICPTCKEIVDALFGEGDGQGGDGGSGE